MELSWITVAVFVAIGGYLVWTVTHFKEHRRLGELPSLSEDYPTLLRVQSLIPDKAACDRFVAWVEEHETLREIASFSDDRMQRTVEEFRSAIEQGWKPGDTRKAHRKWDRLHSSHGG